MRNNYLFSEKVLVDADNKFSVRGFEFSIPEKNENYRVIKKYDEVDDYENEANMNYIMVVIGRDYEFYFYDELGEAVEGIRFL